MNLKKFYLSGYIFEKYSFITIEEFIYNNKQYEFRSNLLLFLNYLSESYIKDILDEFLFIMCYTYDDDRDFVHTKSLVNINDIKKAMLLL